MIESNFNYATFEAVIQQIANDAAQVHRNVNQYYGKELPYIYHLRMVSSFAIEFLPLITTSANDSLAIIMAAYYHDAIEDARMSYNDIVKRFQKLAQENHVELPVTQAAEIVYALTNEKGRTRTERANDKYYEGIRNTPFAPYVKMCDRLANVKHSTLFFPHSRMATVYASEAKHFIDSITIGATSAVPQQMIDLMYEILHQEFKQ